MRLNNERRVDGKTLISDQVKSSQPDLLLTKDNVEFGVGECGKIDLGSIGKKEILETQLHLPKLMKDVFTRAVSKAGNDVEFARKFQVVGFSHTCKVHPDLNRQNMEWNKN